MAVDRLGAQSVPAHPAPAPPGGRAVSRGFFRAAGIPFAVQGSSGCRGSPAWWWPTTPATSTGSSPWRLCRPILPSSSRRRWCACRSRACLLRRLGSQFVERFDRHKGGVRCAARAEARRHRPVLGVLSGRHLRCDPPDRQVSRRRIRHGGTLPNAGRGRGHPRHAGGAAAGERDAAPPADSLRNTRRASSARTPGSAAAN